MPRLLQRIAKARTVHGAYGAEMRDQAILPVSAVSPCLDAIAAISKVLAYPLRACGDG
jgi:hypothetical protein